MLTARTLALTSFTVIAFAANSILCRLALRSGTIDPASFTSVRLVSATAVLALVVGLRRFKNDGGAAPGTRSDWISGPVLFCYAIAFSFAYIGLNAGTGALILFGTVQATMILAGILGGHHPRPGEWIGLVVALSGLIYLVAPGLAAPPIPSACLMAFAGVGWGIYSLRGRRVSDPAAANAAAFKIATPIALIASLALFSLAHGTAPGFGWAALSGGVTTGLGYILWYAALPGLGATRAAIVQLAVPVVAATGGVALMGEPLTPRLVLATGITLSGVAVAILGRGVS